MSWNPEIMGICRKLKSTRAVVEKADYFLRKLNRKTSGSMGAVDMLKYLVCVDLAYRDLGLKWDSAIANRCGLKSKQYGMTFTKISNKLAIAKNKTISFDQLAKHFRRQRSTSRKYNRITLRTPLVGLERPIIVFVRIRNNSLLQKASLILLRLH